MSHVPKTFDALAEYVSQGETHDHCWHLGCILPRVPAMIVRAGRVLWEGEAAGDVVHRRVRKEGEAALKRVAWKPSLHCQKPSIAIKQLVAPMHAASENPVDEIMTAARSLFAGPGTVVLALSFAGPQWLRAAFDGCVWACRAGEGCGERHAQLPRNLVPPVRHIFLACWHPWRTSTSIAVLL